MGLDDRGKKKVFERLEMSSHFQFCFGWKHEDVFRQIFNWIRFGLATITLSAMAISAINPQSNQLQILSFTTFLESDRNLLNLSRILKHFCRRKSY